MSTTTDLYTPAGRHFARLEQADRQRYEAWLLDQGAQEGYSLDDWLDIAYPCSPVPWRSAFGG